MQSATTEHWTKHLRLWLLGLGQKYSSLAASLSLYISIVSFKVHVPRFSSKLNSSNMNGKIKPPQSWITSRSISLNAKGHSVEIASPHSVSIYLKTEHCTQRFIEVIYHFSVSALNEPSPSHALSPIILSAPLILASAITNLLKTGSNLTKGVPGSFPCQSLSAEDHAPTSPSSELQFDFAVSLFLFPTWHMES